jgi:arylsulfatase A-like enzyme
LVSSVDLAPTVLELAGLPIDSTIQGLSMVPLLTGGTAPERSLLIESDAYENPFPHLVDMDYRAIRTARYKYIHWIKHPAEAELYDLQTDPLERRNLVDDPGLRAVRDSLRAELGRLVAEAIGLGAPIYRTRD